jgi:hypothetical protein
MRTTFGLTHALSLALCAFPLLAMGCGGERIPVSPEPPRDLEARAETEARGSAKGGERVGDTLRGVAHKEDAFTDWRIELQEGQCYWFGYAGDAGVERFSMYIWDPKDKRLDSARGKPPQGVFTHCAEQTGIYRLQGKVAEGAGHYAVVVYKTKAAEKKPEPVVVAKEPEKKPTVDLAAIIEKKAAQSAVGAKRSGDFVDGTGETSEFYTAMEVGKCYWVIGAGEPGKVKKLFLYLWDPKSKRVTESKTDSDTAMVGHCAKESGMYKYQLKVDSGSGAYKAAVYIK